MFFLVYVFVMGIPDSLEHLFETEEEKKKRKAREEEERKRRLANKSAGYFDRINKQIADAEKGN